MAGLIQGQEAALGVARADANTAPTELYLAYENADYTYVSSATQHDFNGDGTATDSSKLLIALDVYETWQKSLLMAEMMKTACWTLAAADDGDNNTTDFVAGDNKGTDNSGWCHYTNADQAGAQRFHPLI